MAELTAWLFAGLSAGLSVGPTAGLPVDLDAGLAAVCDFLPLAPDPLVGAKLLFFL